MLTLPHINMSKGGRAECLTSQNIDYTNPLNWYNSKIQDTLIQDFVSKTEETSESPPNAPRPIGGARLGYSLPNLSRSHDAESSASEPYSAGLRRLSGNATTPRGQKKLFLTGIDEVASEVSDGDTLPKQYGNLVSEYGSSAPVDHYKLVNTPINGILAPPKPPPVREESEKEKVSSWLDRVSDEQGSEAGSKPNGLTDSQTRMESASQMRKAPSLPKLYPKRRLKSALKDVRRPKKNLDKLIPEHLSRDEHQKRLQSDLLVRFKHKERDSRRSAGGFRYLAPPPPQPKPAQPDFMYEVDFFQNFIGMDNFFRGNHNNIPAILHTPSRCSRRTPPPKSVTFGPALYIDANGLVIDEEVKPTQTLPGSSITRAAMIQKGFYDYRDGKFVYGVRPDAPNTSRPTKPNPQIVNLDAQSTHFTPQTPVPMKTIPHPTTAGGLTRVDEHAPVRASAHNAATDRVRTVNDRKPAPSNPSRNPMPSPRKPDVSASFSQSGRESQATVKPVGLASLKESHHTPKEVKLEFGLPMRVPVPSETSLSLNRKGNRTPGVPLQPKRYDMFADRGGSSKTLDSYTARIMSADTVNTGSTNSVKTVSSRTFLKYPMVKLDVKAFGFPSSSPTMKPESVPTALKEPWDVPPPPPTEEGHRELDTILRKQSGVTDRQTRQSEDGDTVASLKNQSEAETADDSEQQGLPADRGDVILPSRDVSFAREKSKVLVSRDHSKMSFTLVGGDASIAPQPALSREASRPTTVTTSEGRPLTRGRTATTSASPWPGEVDEEELLALGEAQDAPPRAPQSSAASRRSGLESVTLISEVMTYPSLGATVGVGAERSEEDG